MVELKIELLRKGVSQADIVRKTGLSTSYVSDIVRGKRKANHVRARLVELFRLNPDKVLLRSGK